MWLSESCTDWAKVVLTEDVEGGEEHERDADGESDDVIDDRHGNGCLHLHAAATKHSPRYVLQQRGRMRI